MDISPLVVCVVCMFSSKRRDKQEKTEKESESVKEPFMNYNLMTAVSSSCLFSTIFSCNFRSFRPVIYGI